jgi:hypothetical protein
MDYKSLRILVKNNKLDQKDYLEMVKKNLDELVVDKKFPHATSQKEEIVDKAYLNQWLKENQWK